MSRLGLVLTGGGARAAYQVGAVRALAQILAPQKSPFQVMAGVSAGAINIASLATGADNLVEASERLTKTWLSLTPDRVYRTDLPSLLSIGSRWIRDLGTGPLFQGRPINHLLDTRPLRDILEHELDLQRIQNHFRSGVLRGVALSTTNYLTGTAVTFFDGAQDIDPWSRSTRIGIREALKVDHVMASAAIPIFFPPVQMNGSFLGDGCVRLTTPLSPAIHLGANRLIAISVRYFRTSNQTAELNQETRKEHLTLSDIAGVLLNSVFLDSLEVDIERLERINRTLSLIPDERMREVPHALRRIPVLTLRPSQDLGTLAADLLPHFPALMRHLLSGAGVGGSQGNDLMSYLAFESTYVTKLIELGMQDTFARASELKAFVTEP